MSQCVMTPVPVVMWVFPLRLQVKCASAVCINVLTGMKSTRVAF